MPEPLTTDQIALAVEIPELYDGTAVYVMRDGSVVNRFALDLRWDARLVARVDEWIAAHGRQLPPAHTGLPTPREQA